MRCRCWISTLMALLGLLLPWARVMAVSAHLSIGDHEISAADHVADLEESFHGHPHAEGTTDHRHPWIGVDLVARMAPEIRVITAPAQSQLAVTPPASTRVTEVMRGRNAILRI